MTRAIVPIILLVISNVFMTFAWYGHLKFKSAALPVVIICSWLIAFFEYCFQVPANRIGSEYFSTAQLKITQEVITFSVFLVFSVLYLKESFKWDYVISFILITFAAYFAFRS
ncbi:MAG: DMT family protein [Ignavibacteriales bacterium]